LRPCDSSTGIPAGCREGNLPSHPRKVEFVVARDAALTAAGTVALLSSLSAIAIVEDRVSD
jgi:hypothetical protein